MWPQGPCPSKGRFLTGAIKERGSGFGGGKPVASPRGAGERRRVQNWSCWRESVIGLVSEAVLGQWLRNMPGFSFPFRALALNEWEGESNRPSNSLSVVISFSFFSSSRRLSPPCPQSNEVQKHFLFSLCLILHALMIIAATRKRHEEESQELKAVVMMISEKDQPCPRLLQNFLLCKWV